MLRGARTAPFFLAAAILEHPRRLGPGGQDHHRRPRRLDREAAATERDRVEQGIVGGEPRGQPFRARRGGQGAMIAAGDDRQRGAGGAGADQADPAVGLAAYREPVAERGQRSSRLLTIVPVALGEGWSPLPSRLGEEMADRPRAAGRFPDGPDTWSAAGSSQPGRL